MRQKTVFRLAAALAGLLLAYLAASWAIDSGRLSVYFLTLILLVASVKLVVAAWKGRKHG